MRGIFGSSATQSPPKRLGRVREGSTRRCRRGHIERTRPLDQRLHAGNAAAIVHPDLSMGENPLATSIARALPTHDNTRIIPRTKHGYPIHHRLPDAPGLDFQTGESTAPQSTAIAERSCA